MFAFNFLFYSDFKDKFENNDTNWEKNEAYFRIHSFGSIE